MKVSSCLNLVLPPSLPPSLLRSFVGRFQKRSERSNDQSSVRFTNVFVKNLDADINEAQLTEAFSSVGRITNAVIMRDETGASRGFGFVNYETAEAAAQAVEHLNGQMVGQKAVFVGRAMKKAEREQLLRKQFEEQKMERFQKLQVRGGRGEGQGSGSC